VIELVRADLCRAEQLAHRDLLGVSDRMRQ
jgi:hypothetical protein